MIHIKYYKFRNILNATSFQILSDGVYVTFAFQIFTLCLLMYINFMIFKN